MEKATLHATEVLDDKQLQEKIFEMLRHAPEGTHIRTRHYGDVVEITELRPGETRDTDTQELPPPSVSSEPKFDAQLERLRLRLRLAQAL